MEKTLEQCIRPLAAILSVPRPHKSYQEERFIRDNLMSIGGIKDPAGNVLFDIPGNGYSNIMFSCHLDTVADRKTASSQQRICFDGRFMKLARPNKHDCLGADDGAGIWLMLEMIEEKVPGFYLFHRGEEAGCIGSRWIANNRPGMLAAFQAAIAFDRMGTKDIITHQVGQRCASDEFANSLSDALGGGFKPSSHGMYTDTASYTHHIGECTNVSVGYHDAHGGSERLDVHHLLKLRNRLCNGFDQTKLVFQRKPGENERTYSSSYYRGLDQSCIAKFNGDPDILRLVRRNPEAVAAYLCDVGLSYEDLYNAVLEKNDGVVFH